MNKYPKTVALDFDNTVAKTFYESFGARNVQTAYEYAIQDLFGDDAVALYRAQGGLKGRAPTEVVLGLGVKSEDVIETTNRLVEQKLTYLLPQIGTPTEGGGIWPELCDGFADFWNAAQSFVADGRLLMAIVSNGHDIFISRVFEAHGLNLPNALVTDEDVRGRKDIEPSKRYKPSPIMLELAANRLGVERLNLYIGDSITADGAMARNASTEFGYYSPRQSGSPEPLSGGFRFGEWRELISYLPEFEFPWAESFLETQNRA